MKSELKALLFAAFCGTGLIATAGTEGTVTADLLNVRLKPELKSVVVAKLPYGTKVDILGTVGDFYEISAPDRTPVYVSAVYLRDGKVLSPVKMRTAMDRHAAAYGLLPAGTKVKVLLETPLGWAKIAPPASLKVYTAKNYVKAAEPVKESEAAKPAEAEKPAAPEAAKAVAVDVRPLEKAPEAPAEVKTAPAGEKKAPAAPVEVKKAPAAPVEVKKAPAAPVEVKKAPEAVRAPVEAPKEAEKAAEPDQLDEQLKKLGVDLSKSTEITAAGYMVEIPNTTVEAVKYAVMKLDAKGQYVKSCFVCSSDAALLKSAVERNVKVTGRAYSVPTWKTPVVKVTALELTK